MRQGCKIIYEEELVAEIKTPTLNAKVFRPILPKEEKERRERFFKKACEDFVTEAIRVGAL